MLLKVTLVGVFMGDGNWCPISRGCLQIGGTTELPSINAEDDIIAFVVIVALSMLEQLLLFKFVILLLRLLLLCIEVDPGVEATDALSLQLEFVADSSTRRNAISRSNNTSASLDSIKLKRLKMCKN